MKPSLGLWILLFVSVPMIAQQTVFNVPSGDVLERGEVYGEVDITYQHSNGLSTFTPRVVVGAGHGIEVGLNLGGFATPGKQAFTPTPTIKWKLFEDSRKRLSWLAGDDLFIPAQHRTYTAGNYVWTEAARTWTSGTRLTFGVYHATANVFGSRQKVGAQMAFEQPINTRVTIAADWYSGDCSVCFVTPGVVIKATRKLTWYGAYQLGNRDLSRGNHQLLMELGWNLN